MPLVTALILISTIALVFGVSYAFLIYHRPFGHGWTWLSVVIGDGATDFMAGVAIVAILAAVDRLDLWPMAFVPVISHILTGAPMIAGQLLKWWNEWTYANSRGAKFQDDK